MSTRGTYLFNGRDEWAPNTCIYVHCDNYPLGAIHKIWAAFKVSGQVTIESFIRGNDRAEITQSHEAHGDTEYRYTFDGHRLTVHDRPDYGDTWRVIFTGYWWEFVEANRDDDWPIDGYEPVKFVRTCSFHKKSPMTNTMLRDERKSKMRTAGRWLANGDGDSIKLVGNLAGCVKDIQNLDTLIGSKI